ncbi:hypothetical protein PtB15_17B155 [Puccinia triticina]|nr:hypothetical protein PtB15_17B155 [Puccinia triticina]
MIYGTELAQFIGIWFPQRDPLTSSATAIDLGPTELAQFIGIWFPHAGNREAQTTPLNKGPDDRLSGGAGQSRSGAGQTQEVERSQ